MLPKQPCEPHLKGPSQGDRAAAKEHLVDQGTNPETSQPEGSPDAAAQEPLVSAIVVNYDGGEVVGECIQSLVDQTYANIEILVVDNASSDGSAELVEKQFGAKVRVIRNAKNQGFAGGNNRALEVAKGDLFFLLNNDAAADPECVEELVTFLSDKPDVGMLACRVVQYDQPNYFDSTGLLVYPDGVCRSRGWQEKDTGQYDNAQEVLCPHGAAALYRRTMVDDAGAFDEAYFAYLEDLDLGFRGQMMGWKCWYVPTARVLHRKSFTAGNYSKFKAYHVERNRIYNAIKLMPRFLVFVSPLFALNRYLMQGYAAFTHQGASKEFVKEYSYFQLLWILIKTRFVALWKLPHLLRERRRITSNRKITTQEWYGLITRFKLDAIELALKA